MAWQRADDLFIAVHKMTLAAFPSHEKFELGSQTRRAAFSVPANIVEGCAREHRRERLQSLNVARASLAELGYCLHVGKRLGYLSDADFEAMDLAVKKVGAPLSGLISAVRSGRAL